MNRTSSEWRRRRRFVSGSLLAIALAGCADVPTPDQPAAPSVAEALRVRSALLKEQPALSEEALPSQWWDVFNDAALAGLESKVSGNLDLQAAAARIQESRAQLGLTEAAGRPALAMDASVARSALSEHSTLYRLGVPSTPSNTWNLGLEAGWELDLWGYHRNLSASARAKLDAAYFGREAVRVSVAAEVARGYLLLRGTQAQIGIAEANERIAKDMLRMAESRVRNGVASHYDVAAARADLADIEARLLQLQRQRTDQANAVALLLGLPPHELDGALTGAALPPMPAMLPIGVSSELARQRPDILQAQSRLSAAVADMGAAHADFYPRISLGAGFGMQAYELSNLGSWASRNFSVGPTFHLPIFEGGRLRSQLALSEARHQLAAIEYQRTVLRAWHEVDDALRAYASERERHSRLEEALRQNETALAVARHGYREGTKDFTAVLVARRSLLASQSALADCATASALSVVSLYRAVGGGWSPDLLAHAETERGS